MTSSSETAATPPVSFWAIAVGIIAAVTRLFGAISLLLRRTWALPLYGISAVFFIAALCRAFVLANVANVISASHIAVELVFLTLSVFSVWFARDQKIKGLLR